MLNEASNNLKWPIIGHSNIVSYLQNSLTSNSLAHAYLFVGPDHVGKTTVAKLLVNSLVCDNFALQKNNLPCGQCRGCRQVATGIHPDVYWVRRELNEKTEKFKKNIGIEQIRSLQSKLGLRSFLNSYKVAIVADAQTLSLEAANSLLKGLEEPAPRTVMILLSNSVARLPKTIVSRCQVIKFRPVADKKIVDHLVNLKIERKKSRTLAALAFGLPGVALSYVDDKSNYFELQDSIKTFLGLIDQDIATKFKMINEVLNNDPEETKEILLLWRKILRDALLIKANVSNLVSNISLATEIKRLATKLSINEIRLMITEIDQTKKYLDSNVGVRLTLENLVLKF